jgi:peroxiredoxin
MEAYRDQYAKLFNNGKGVAVIGISTDADTAQASWAHDARLPIYFASDPDGAVVKLYDVKMPAINYARRVLFVVDPTGHVSYVASPFKEMVEDSYTELGTAVAEAMKKH